MTSLLPGIPRVESPLFHAELDDFGWTEEELRVALDLHERGFAVIDFPDPDLDARIERIKDDLAPLFAIDLDDPTAIKNDGRDLRVQDAWLFHEDVRAIATNTEVINLLQRLYGRPPVPFQTLNFPVGTQQHLHSDSNHFSSIPERFMCGVWLAMEDVHADAGPLTYLPGSHTWPVLTNIMVGRKAAGERAASAQTPFQEAWTAMVRASGKRQETFLARKGQALIWAANLLHGGSPQRDATRTRWSQVTHYYFEDCIYYTPGHSDEPIGRLEVRSVRNICTGQIQPNLFLGEDFEKARAGWQEPASRQQGRWWKNLFRRKEKAEPVDLPPDFDPEAYLLLNPDIASAKLDPAEHYRRHGRTEARTYRIR